MSHHRQLKIAFIPTNVSGVIFYRAFQPAEALRRLGHKVAVLWYAHDQYLKHPWEWDIDKPGAEFISRDIEMACDWADIVIWMGLHTPASLELFMDLRNIYQKKKFVLEMDDYLFSTPPENAASHVYGPGSPLLRTFVNQAKVCDGMIVSTPYLRELYKPYNRNIHIIENAIDLNLWRSPPTHPPRQRINLGWVGGGSHNKDHEMIKDVVFQTLGRFKDVHFECLHGCPHFYRNHPKIHCPMDVDGLPIFMAINKYPRWVKKHSFDIGLAPLQDNNFNRGKSNLRWLEYSAMGIPTIASSVGHFKETIQPGETGLLASNHAEWLYDLKFLITEEKARLRIGRSAQAEVKRRWNPKVMGMKLITALKEILNAESDPAEYTEPDHGSNQRSEQPAMVN